MPASRYLRQIMVWGGEAQEALASSRVLVAGLGGLGSAASFYLTAAGVGKLVLVDHDWVEKSDLNRQVLHWDRDVGRLKVESAAEKLRMLNPEVEVEPIAEKLSSVEQAVRLVSGVDVVVDCLDNWPSRFLLNEACVRAAKPLVHAAVEGAAGWLTVVKPGEGPCLRCIFPRAPPEKSAIPVIGPLPGVLGAAEAFEALKLLTGFGKPLLGRLFYLDLAEATVETFSLRKRLDCPVCSQQANPSSPARSGSAP